LILLKLTYPLKKPQEGRCGATGVAALGFSPAWLPNADLKVGARGGVHSHHEEEKIAEDPYPSVTERPDAMSTHRALF
jgi:hypothetical protein